MFKTNEQNLVMISVEGKVAPALAYPNEIGHDGKIHNIPSIGGITYNVKIGNNAFGWEADHIEPCVSSILNSDKRRDRPNLAYNFLACIGNEAIIVSGDAKGAKGVVTGHHGGVEHVIIDFSDDVLKKLTHGDRIQIKSFGQGLKIDDAPEISISSIDPSLFKKIVKKNSRGALTIDVKGIIPAKLMGSGVGEGGTRTGDIDIITSDKNALKKYDLNDLKLGDIIAIENWDSSIGWCYKKGYTTIGVIIHGDSHLAGHGPGVTAIMSSLSGNITVNIKKSANIGQYLKIGKFRNE